MHFLNFRRSNLLNIYEMEKYKSVSNNPDLKWDDLLQQDGLLKLTLHLLTAIHY